MKFHVLALAVLCVAGAALAQTKPADTVAAMTAEAKKDVVRHRAMAAAHEAAAKCLETGKAEEVCHKELQASCKGLAIGRYCGMRHEH